MTPPEDDEDVDSGWDMGELSVPSVPAPAPSVAPLPPPVSVEVTPDPKVEAKPAAVARPTALKPASKLTEPAKPTAAKAGEANGGSALKPLLKPAETRSQLTKPPEASKGGAKPDPSRPAAPKPPAARPLFAAKPLASKGADLAPPHPTAVPLAATTPMEGELDATSSPPREQPITDASGLAQHGSTESEDDGAVDLSKTVEAPIAASALTSKLLELSKRVDAALGMDAEPTSAAPTVRRDVPEVPKTLAERIAARITDGELDISEKNTPPGGVEIASLGELDDDPVPATRRASDDELREVKTRASVAPALRLGGAKGGKRSTTPLHTDAVTKAKQLDARIHSRPTPPARPPITPPPPANTAIRFGSEVPNLTRTRATAATKVNFAAVKLADSTREAESKGSAPALDLHLPDDLSGATPATVAETPSANKPEISFELDDLPVEEMIESARPSTRPPPPPAQPAPSPAKSGLGLSKATEKTPQQAKPIGSTGKAPMGAAPRPPGGGLARPGGFGAGPATPLRSPSAKKAEPASGGSAGQTPVPSPAAPAVQVGSDAELTDDEAAALSDELSFDGLLDGVDGGAAAGGLSLELDEPGAVSRIAPEAVPTRVVFEEDPAVEPIRVRFEKGDYFGAMVRAESVLEHDPDNEQVRSYLESARDLVAQMYKEKLGSGEQVLRLAMAPSDIQNLALDHRAGFLISLVDGVATVDEILDMSGMPEIDVLRLLYEMREQGVVSVDSMAPA